MGAEVSGAKTEKEFLTEYENLRTEYDVRFGEVGVYQKRGPPHNQVIAKEKVFQDDKVFKKFETQLKKRKLIMPTNVAPIVDIICISSFNINDLVDQKKEWCSSFYKCLITYEFHERTLDQLLRYRKTYQNNDAKVS